MVDKFAKKGIFIDGALARRFPRGRRGPGRTGQKRGRAGRLHRRPHPARPAATDHALTRQASGACGRARPAPRSVRLRRRRVPPVEEPK
ncbi:MAG: hypothetical protein U1F53_20340 [Burkholderiaceae bacterium]